MAGQVLQEANPPPLPSHLPDSILDLAVQTDKKPLDEKDAKSLRDYQNAACYIAAGKPILLCSVWSSLAGRSAAYPRLTTLSDDLSAGQRAAGVRA